MSRSLISRKTSIYKLIEDQRRDLKKASKHLLYNQRGSIDDDVDDTDEELYEVVIVIPSRGFHIIEPLLDLLSDRLPQLIVHKKSFTGHRKIGLFIRSCDKFLKESIKMRITISTRQSIIKCYLDSLRYSDDPAHNPAERMLIKVTGVKFETGEAILHRLIQLKYVECIFPIHSRIDLNELRLLWVSSFLSPQPLDLIRKYFGFRIAMYFAFLGHYTQWLIAPAFLGLFVTLFSNDLLILLYTLAMFIWSVLYLKSLDTYCRQLSHEWSSEDDDTINSSTIRPQFNGKVIYDDVSDTIQIIYPEWRRKAIKYALTLPIIALSLVTLFYIMFYTLQFQTYWDETLILERGYPVWSSCVPRIIFGVISTVLDAVYCRIAVWLNCLENHPFELAHENALISKLIVFQFVNSFLSLFYIAFYLGDMDKLQQHLAAVLITRQVVDNIYESVIPFIGQSFKVSKITTHSSPCKELTVVNNQVTAAEIQSYLDYYESTYEDHLEMFIQFANVTLFSSLFPLASVCALVNNVIEIRSDAFKLCVTHKRPFAGPKVKDIGEWLAALHTLVYISIIVNCALLVKSGLIQRLFTFMNDTQAQMTGVLLEHFMIVLKFTLENRLDKSLVSLFFYHSD